MNTWILITIAAVFAAAWIPVGVYFWRSWRMRGAPLSLAICGLVGYPIYTNLSTGLFLENDPAWVALILVVVNALILGNFYLCFRWQRKAFPNARRSPTGNHPAIHRLDLEEDTDEYKPIAKKRPEGR